MSTLSFDAPSAREDLLDGARSFLVTRQDPVSRAYRRMGVLTQLPDGWAFRYFADVAADTGVQRLPGFPDASRVAVSSSLFPLFSQRVLSPRRPDRAEILENLGLDESASAFEFLAANGGRRQGDTIELIQLPVPHPGGGETLQFLVHGMRYRTVEEQRVVDKLRVGDPLRIEREPDNAVDATARLVATETGTVLGWVPAPLTWLIERAGEIAASVAHVNNSSTPPHLRLLVELRGSLVEAAHFSDPRWDLVG
ncbi:HIRAN domain-containing protein [Brachybacterium sp. J144]|uniref:HIRAN domain-containing protein n=1 Tax=Brachybacterium sp. J144 TaxID=3116487 RepID=UPI002E78F192|nr:HIRAN domain-containing protein [Brachybacterium sp. J144]MEE1650586.1 HIRAN domain-containing protein [Brachybacterium sp. J144]